MSRMRRDGFFDFEKREIWRGWKNGQTLRGIGRGRGRRSSHGGQEIQSSFFRPLRDIMSSRVEMRIGLGPVGGAAVARPPSS